MKLNVAKVLLLFLLVFSFTSCLKEDDFNQDGNLNISFSNRSSDIILSIYSIENETIPIYKVSMDNRAEINIPLNVGNYIIKPYSSSTFYGSMGFQIMKNKTTYIEFDNNNIGTVMDTY